MVLKVLENDVNLAPLSDFYSQNYSILFERFCWQNNLEFHLILSYSDACERKNYDIIWKRFHWMIQGSDPERPGPVVSVLENFLGAK